MKYTAIRFGVLLAALLFSGQMLMAQQTKIKESPIRPTSTLSGKVMFHQYCAVCHGADAKGDGPAAASLKVRPPNLTTLAERHGGKFPTAYVISVLRFGAQNYPTAHGKKEMPIWGPLFGSISGSVAAPAVTLRIHNLTEYLESIQVK